MITLRDQARRDTAIGAVTMDECRFISRILNRIAGSYLLRLLMGSEVRARLLDIGMLAATFSRTPKEMIPLESEIRIAMLKDMGADKK